MHDRLSRPARAPLAALALAALLLAAGLTAIAPVTSGFSAKAQPGRSSFAAAAVFAPRLLAAPAISGTARQGETLTATTGSWARGVDSFRVEWLRCDRDACTPVGEGSRRELTAADVGATMRVRVTATNAGGSSDARSAATAPVAAMAAPRSTAAPAISGSATVGRTLTASDGSWDGDRLSLTRRWLRCTTACAAIPGETGERYVVTGDDSGAALKVEVTATNAVGTATASSAPTAAVDRTTYVHVLCRNPRDGTSVGSDGALPNGLGFGRDVIDFPAPDAATRCASPGGIPLSTGGAWTTSTVNGGGWLQYRAVTSIQFASAELYRHGQNGGAFSWAVNTSTETTIFGTPRDDLCSWGLGCSSLGTSASPFDPGNRVDVARGPVNGFNVVLLCDIPGGWTCYATGAERVVLTGGLVQLRDLATPRIIKPAGGGLSYDPTLTPVDTLTINADDMGSGLYRVRVTIDHVEVAARRVPGAQPDCADVDPAGGDAYEFAQSQPCVPRVAGTMEFDTTAWPKTGRLRVYLEDAGRNTTVLVNRRLGA